MTWFLVTFLSWAGASGKVTEAELSLCEKDADCVVVAYHHCCGQTKRAINQRHRDLYEKTPAWRSFNDPATCSVMGLCPSDATLTTARCKSEGSRGASKRCVLSEK